MMKGFWIRFWILLVLAIALMVFAGIISVGELNKT
jgi:hypothetical protein